MSSRAVPTCSYVGSVISDESDASREIVSVWRQNVFAAENGGELQKMEDLYNRLDREREKWNERLNNPLTWGWGGGPDELNDWARETKEVTASPGWGEWQPDESNDWTNDAVYKHPYCRGDRPVNSDKTPEGVFNVQNPGQAPPPLPRLVSSYAEKLKADGRERSYAFAQVSSPMYFQSITLTHTDSVQLSTEAKAEKIREVAYQLKGSKKH